MHWKNSSSLLAVLPHLLCANRPRSQSPGDDKVNFRDVSLKIWSYDETCAKKWSSLFNELTSDQTQCLKDTLQDESLNFIDLDESFVVNSWHDAAPPLWGQILGKDVDFSLKLSEPELIEWLFHNKNTQTRISLRQSWGQAIWTLATTTSLLWTYSTDWHPNDIPIQDAKWPDSLHADIVNKRAEQPGQETKDITFKVTGALRAVAEVRASFLHITSAALSDSKSASTPAITKNQYAKGFRDLCGRMTQWKALVGQPNFFFFQGQDAPRPLFHVLRDLFLLHSGITRSTSSVLTFNVLKHCDIVNDAGEWTWHGFTKLQPLRLIHDSQTLLRSWADLVIPVLSATLRQSNAQLDNCTCWAGLSQVVWHLKYWSLTGSLVVQPGRVAYRILLGWFEILTIPSGFTLPSPSPAGVADLRSPSFNNIGPSNNPSREITIGEPIIDVIRRYGVLALPRDFGDNSTAFGDSFSYMKELPFLSDKNALTKAASHCRLLGIRTTFKNSPFAINLVEQLGFPSVDTCETSSEGGDNALSQEMAQSLLQAVWEKVGIPNAYSPGVSIPADKLSFNAQ